MQMAELSGRTGVAVPTLKYYLREGLLMPGLATSATRSTYSEEHVARVRLVRALVETGGLSLASARAVVVALNAPVERALDFIGTAHEALPAPGSEHPESAEVADLVTDLGWRVDACAVARRSLSAALEATAQAGVPVGAEDLRRYARAAEAIAEVDVQSASTAPDLTHMLHTVVVGTVMIDPVLSALRRLAQEHVSMSRLAPSPAHRGDPTVSADGVSADGSL